MKQLTLLLTLVLSFAIGHAGNNLTANPDKGSPSRSVQDLRVSTESALLSLPQKSEIASTMPHAVSRVHYTGAQAAAAVEEVPLAGVVCWSDTMSTLGFCKVHFNGDIEVVNNPYTRWPTGVRVGTTWYGITSGQNASDPNQWVVDLGAYDLTKDFKNTMFEICDNKGLVATDLTYDQTTHNIYGCFFNDDGSGYVFGTINFEEKQRTVICNLSERWQAIAADTDGTLYVFTINGILGTVNKETGAFTEIGDTGLRPTYYSSMHIDPDTHRMFLSYEARADQPQETGIWEVDKATAAVTNICRYGGRTVVAGLYTPIQTDPAAPGAPQGLEAVFEGNSLTGVIKFTAPTTLHSGEAASGDVDYEVKVGATTVLTGTTTYGAKVELPVTVKYHQEYEISARMLNAAGYSDKVELTRFIGYGEPSAPSNVKLEYNRSTKTFTLTWDAVKGSTDGSFIDPSKVMYEVKRMPDNYRDYTFNNSFTYILPQEVTGSYYYELTTYYDGYASQTVKSNVVHIGTLTPPYTNTFDSEGEFYEFSQIDANEDDKTWYQYTATDSGKALLRPPLGPVDDWLVSPLLKLNAGEVYEISFVTEIAKAANPETFGVFLGKEATPEGLNVKLMDYTAITETAPVTRRMTVKVDETGEYYIGIHAFDDNCYYLMIDDFTVTAPLDGGLPEAPGLVVAPKEDDPFYCTVTITAPTKSINGSDLTEPLSLVELYKGSERVFYKRNVEPGTVLTYGESESEAAVVAFTAVATNASGRGTEAAASAYIGVALANPPSDFNAYEIGVGNTHLIWTPPTTDVNGMSVDPASLTYTLFTIKDGELNKFIGRYIPMTELSLTECLPNEAQRFVQYALFTENAAGINNFGVTSPIFPVGKPDEMPFYESAPAGYLQSEVVVDNIVGEGRWLTLADNIIQGVTSADGDNGLMAFFATSTGDHASIETGKYNITGSNPVLSFQYLPFGDEDTNSIDVLASLGENKFVLLATIPQSGETGVWKKATIPMTDYIGKSVRLQFRGNCGSHQYTFIDNIRLVDVLSHNMSASDVRVPETVRPGKSFTVSARFENIGAETAKNVRLVVLHDNQILHTETLDEVAPDEVVNISFEHQYSILDQPTHTFSSVVIFADDKYSDDNFSATQVVEIEQPIYPAPTNLSGVFRGNDVELKWTAPGELDNKEPDDMTEDFENSEYPAFAITDFGPWTLKSLNPNDTYLILDGASGAYDYPHAGEPTGFMLFTPSAMGNERPEYAPHSGNTVLVSIGHIPTASYPQNDDWLISPELNMLPKDLKFWAKSAISRYPESLEVLVSYSDNNPSSFEKITIPNYSGSVPSDWYQYKVEIPIEAKYFAIRCTSQDMLCLMIDDIELTDKSSGLTLEKYNIYRDGEFVGTAAADSPTYTDTNVPGDSYFYQVSALYNVGESSVTGANVASTAIDAINANNVKVYTEPRMIVVEGADGDFVEIISAQGLTIYAATVADQMKHSVTPGVYLVRLNGVTTKLMVK